MGEQYKPYAASYLVLMQNNQVLLARRVNTGYMDGMYSLPAGHFEDNETAREVMVRETKEEIGIEVDSQDLESVAVLHRKANDREYIDFFFLCNRWQGEIENLEPEKCDDIAWFGIDDLPDQITPEVLFVLEQLDDDRIYYEFNW